MFVRRTRCQACSLSVEALEQRQLLAVTMPQFLRVNFQPGNAEVPAYHRIDTGATYGLRSNGLTYGWDADNRANARDRNSSLAPDQRHDTFNHLQKNGSRTWQMSVPNGTYTVRVVAGDAGYLDSVFRINVEGSLVVSGKPTSGSRWVEGTRTVTVSDGKLTISNASGAVNNKIAFVEIAKGTSPLPVVSVQSIDAKAGETDDPGLFRISRVGNTSADLTVRYTVSGSATPGLDYSALFGEVTIPAGQSSVDVSVQPIDDNLAESSETVVLKISDDYAYSPATGASATVTIYDNDGGSTQVGKLKWTTAASAPVVRTEHMTAMVGGKLYLIDGYLDNKYLSTARADVYDPATNRWARLADLPQKLTHAGCAHDDRYVYLAGGYTVDSTGKKQVIGINNAWRYDTVTDTWSKLPNLPERLGAGAMVLVGRTLYYMGGFEWWMKDTDKIYSLNLDNLQAGWKLFGRMPEPNNHFGAAVLDGWVYVMAGQTGNDATAKFKNSAWRWQPGTSNWQRLPNLAGVARSHVWSSTIAFRNRVWVMGGETDTGTPNKPRSVPAVDVYDPVTNSWSKNTDLPSGRSTGSAAVWDDKIVFSSGMLSGVFKSDTWIGTIT